MLGVRLSPDLEKRLAAVAKKSGRSKSYIARKAIEEKIEDMEDLAAAIAALEDPGENIPWEEVKKRLDLYN